MAAKRPIIMVSSTVYYQESFLDQVFALLEGLGYTVWLSHAGSIFANPGRSAFDNCLDAVQSCDLFLGIITGRYGSGKEGGAKSITHRELDRAISIGKPSWFLVHSDVAVARQLLRQYKKDKRLLTWDFAFEKTSVLDDLRVLRCTKRPCGMMCHSGSAAGTGCSSTITRLRRSGISKVSSPTGEESLRCSGNGMGEPHDGHGGRASGSR